jgi:hypothetical protein
MLLSNHGENFSTIACVPVADVTLNDKHMSYFSEDTYFPSAETIPKQLFYVLSFLFLHSFDVILGEISFCFFSCVITVRQEDW